MATELERKPDVSATDDADVISYASAAQILGLPLGTLYAWVHKRRVPHLRLSARLVRFRRSELLAFLSRHSVAAAFDVKEV